MWFLSCRSEGSLMETSRSSPPQELPSPPPARCISAGCSQGLERGARISFHLGRSINGLLKNLNLQRELCQTAWRWKGLYRDWVCWVCLNIEMWKQHAINNGLYLTYRYCIICEIILLVPHPAASCSTYCRGQSFTSLSIHLFTIPV